ncbi:hypothetical protein L7F22_026373 [Adiantum nelumboides]|nr:hypothetical protein [Adiantum nelumboides]
MFGLYEFLVMPFGLTNAPATFNRMMDIIFCSHQQFVGTFFDDMIVYSKNKEEHRHHLAIVFKELRNYRLLINAKKSEIHFVGHIVSKDGVRMDPAKVGPFQVCDRMSDVAYRLKLPENWKIHNAFHKSLLRPYVGDVPEDMSAEDQPEVEELDEILVLEQIWAHKESKVKGKARKRVEMAGFSLLKRFYFAVYNWVVFFGWLQVLCRTLQTLRTAGYESVYDAVEKPLQFAQTAAVLEILHGLLGLVRSPVSATLPQIGSRLYVTWAVLWSFPETRTSPIVTSLVLSWSITELIRYSFFGMREAFGVSPAWLQWLRYSTFYILYPTGISSELGLIITSLPYVKASEKYCIQMPNKLNIAFDNYFASLATLATYVPGSPYMYSYMIGQRSKALAKAKKSA